MAESATDPKNLTPDNVEVPNAGDDTGNSAFAAAVSGIADRTREVFEDMPSVLEDMGGKIVENVTGAFSGLLSPEGEGLAADAEATDAVSDDADPEAAAFDAEPGYADAEYTDDVIEGVADDADEAGNPTMEDSDEDGTT